MIQSLQECETGRFLLRRAFLVKPKFKIALHECTNEMKPCDLGQPATAREVQHGEWILPLLNNITETKKTFQCCHLWNDLSFWGNNNTEQRMQVCGTAAHSNYFNATKEYNVPTWHACDCDQLGGTETLPTQRESWQWRPSRCTLRDWNASEFCSALGPRRVLMVGDSTMEQTASTLMNMVTTYYAVGNKTAWSCADQLTFALSDRLISSHGDHERGLTLKEYVERENCDIVVLSTAAHWHVHEEVPAILDSVFDAIRQLKTSTTKSNVTFVWKSQNAGDFRCGNFTTPWPESTVAKIEKEIISSRGGEGDGYKWSMFPYIDQEAEKRCIRDRVHYIDMSPTYFRRDAHRYDEKSARWDCLHYCVPGPLNLFATLLLNLMLALSVSK